MFGRGYLGIQEVRHSIHHYVFSRSVRSHLGGAKHDDIYGFLMIYCLRQHTYLCNHTYLRLRTYVTISTYICLPTKTYQPMSTYRYIIAADPGAGLV